MAARRRLGLCGPMPAAVPVRPLRVRPPAAAPLRSGRHAQVVPAAVAHGRVRPPEVVSLPRREPYRREVMA
ncbi:hypothetical protein [Streptosporangium sp. NBC_01756]|uniref:hypothetical protein n=1 Tax=Streptosporangium sp. NBC_01756 TaxID=2975950 RepID=UPI002DD8C43E|nr:hypothetical protein [Streptosporangium sp. NBC_01756]WSC89063.1 hypothetical protein OIE48_12975 [Streptosporangium sp. NBC_01756]